MEFRRAFRHFDRMSECGMYLIRRVRANYREAGFMIPSDSYKYQTLTREHEEEDWNEGPEFRTLDEGKNWCRNHSKNN